MAAAPIAKAQSNDSSGGETFNYEARMAELSKLLAASEAKERQVDEEIAEIVQRNADMPRQMNIVINRMKTQLALAESDASQLNTMLSLTSVLAENISGKVRELDLAKSRVVECLQRVEDILDLKFCTEGVQAALQNEDFEQAAGHIHRFLALDESVLQLSVEENESKTLHQSCEVLRKAEAGLREIVVQKFDEAVADGDVASMERFFKIFPLLNQHDVGLERFASYLQSKISSAAEKNFQTMIAGGQDAKRANVLFPDTLTLLFEGVARIIEVHQPLVETYYGPERMLTLMDSLQKECDFQADRIVDHFIKQRQFSSKAKLIENYSRNPAKFAMLEKLDPIELDVLLTEITLMHTRAELYLRFVKRRISGDLETLPEDHPNRNEKFLKLEKLVTTCGLSRRMQELLNQYVAMEEYFMHESVLKAIKMDTLEDVNLTSSMVDDVFFVVQKCIRRSMSSSNVDCVCAMLNYANNVGEEDLYSVLYGRLKGGYPSVGSLAEAYTTAAAAYTSVMQQGKMPASSADSAERARLLFITTLNNLEICEDGWKNLKESLELDVKQHLSNIGEHDRQKVVMALNSFGELVARFKSGLQFGFEQLATAAIRPRIKASMESFLDYTHTPTESEFTDFEANDPFVESFLSSLDRLLAEFKAQLTERNLQEFVGFVCVEITRRFEKMIVRTPFNRLGGLQLDKEFRDFTNYLTSITSWSMRERFLRFSQIVMLLNVENVSEVKEMFGTSSWRLTPTEIRTYLAQRIDLPADEVHSLKL